ncbi:MAG TPA: ABC transporter ATP-binding protein [Rectinemataceae bacterium]|nr:ABC transporter ATP-binding protein [Rectinemataceae bacterium]
MASLAIEAEGLVRRFGKRTAVDGISFGVGQGEIFGLLGPNGAGKTTSLRLLTGLLRADAGRARVAGREITASDPSTIAKFGVVFEEQNLYDRLSARENLRFNCRLFDLPLSRADEALALVGLADRAKSPAGSLSTGMRQRLLIARALLHRPEVLFLDEPTRGLDPIAAREIRTLVEELRREGATILLTTHLLDEADQLCGRLAFIVDGRIVAEGSPRELKLAHGRRVLSVLVAEEEGERALELGMDDAASAQALSGLFADGRIRSIHSQEASLEEVFVEMAGRRPD